jgi:3'(2'), 5'-bisphosphate nucleotidase
MLSEALLEELAVQCQAWGQRALDLQSHSQLKVDIKDDQSPVTEGDRYVHDEIVRFLSERTLDWPVLSEESTLPGDERLRWPSYWLVDPIDGTKEYIKGSKDFTINIALVERQRVSKSVVAAPGYGEVFLGARGAGAEVWRNGGRHSLTFPHTAPKIPQVLVSRTHRSAEGDLLNKHLTAVDIIQMGSSLKFCRVAEGQADAYFRLFPTQEWDTAAGQGVLEAAGGSVLTLDGQPLLYNRENMRNPPFLAMGHSSEQWLRFLHAAHRDVVDYRRSRTKS